MPLAALLLTAAAWRRGPEAPVGLIAPGGNGTAREVVDAFNRAGFWSTGLDAAIPYELMRESMGPYLADNFVYEFALLHFLDTA